MDGFQLFVTSVCCREKALFYFLGKHFDAPFCCVMDSLHSVGSQFASGSVLEHFGADEI